MNEAENKKAAYDFYGKMPFRKAFPLGLQHVLAMFVGNLTPILIITGACGIGSGTEFAEVQVALLQNAMLVAGIVTLIQLYAIGPVGGKVPDYHGYQLRLYRRIQQRGRRYGRRYPGVRRDSGSFPDWRPF